MVSQDSATKNLRVAVVTPYFRTRDEWLRQCTESVRAQTYPCTHILVADGEPQASVASLNVHHVISSESHADFGDTPRAIGSMVAIGEGFDAIAYLDADNWFHPRHIESLIALHQQTGAAICTSMRSLHRLDGTMMALCLSSDGEQFCDTSCLLLMRPAFQLTAVWALMEPYEHAIDDRVVWYHIKKSGLPRAHTGKPTARYRVSHAGIYRDLKQPAPEGTIFRPEIMAALNKWVANGNPPLNVNWRYGRPIAN